MFESQFGHLVASAGSVLGLQAAKEYRFQANFGTNLIKQEEIVKVNFMTR